MAGRTPREAVHGFLTPLQQAMSCVTDVILLVSGGYYPSQSPHALTLSENPAPLGRNRRIALNLIQQYRVIPTDNQERGAWKVQTVGYFYTLLEPTPPHDEIVAYHWHPESRSAVRYPHFHISSGSSVRRADIRKAHFPTGRIAIEQVLRLVITEFDVQPLRNDWESVLNQMQSSFE
jgi:hypothetical protein